MYSLTNRLSSHRAVYNRKPKSQYRYSYCEFILQIFILKDIHLLVPAGVSSVERVLVANCLLLFVGASLVAQMIKNLPAMQEMQVCSLDGEEILEKGMATCASILAWRCC